MQNTVKAIVEKRVHDGITEISYSGRTSPGLIVAGGFLSLIFGVILNVVFDGKGWSWLGYAVFVVLSFMVLRLFLKSFVKLFVALGWIPSNTIYVDTSGVRTSNNSIPFSDVDLFGTQQNPDGLCFVFAETNGQRVALTGLTDKAQAFKVQSLIVETANQHGCNYK